MYWNLVDDMCYKFTIKFHYACSTILMSREFYNSLEWEMVGNQWLSLVKQNSVRGCHIVIDDTQIMFTLKGREGEELVVRSFEETKFS